MPGATGFKVRLIDLNANTGAFIAVVGTILSRMAEVIEDGSANAGVGQGLQYMLPDPASPDLTNPNWLGPYTIEPQTEPIKLGDKYAILGPFGAALANGPGYTVGVGVTAATPFIQLRSASTSTTVVRVTEFS